MGKAFEIEYKYKKVEIHIIDFVGDVRNINGTPDLFSLSYNSNTNDKGQYILATEAEINIYEDDFFNIDELKTVGETDILIKYFEHDELVWQGFVLPDFFQTGITNVRVLRMVATDRLGVLKDIANTSVSNTPKEIIEECLLQTGLSLPVEIRNNNTHLETTTINRERIEGVSAYDVIRSFMVQFNSKIVQYKNKWWVVNKKLLEDGFLGQEIIDIDLVYLDGQREIKPTASEVSLFLEYGGSQRYPNNWNLNKTFFDPTRGLQFIDWTGALYSVNTSKITGYNFIGNIQNAVLGDHLTDDKSMFYRSGIHPAFGDLNALIYPHFKSEFSTVKLLADTDYKLDFRLNFTSASKIFLEAYILIKKDNNYFVYGHKGKIASAGEGTPAIKNIDPFFIRSADREGFGAVQTQWNAELDINKSTLGILEDADGTFEVQIIIMKDRLGGTISDILETDLFIYSAELALIDNEVESKGLIFKTKQGGDKFSKVRETETTLFSDKINQGVNGYFYNYKYDDTSITNLPKEYLLTMTRQMADMFCSARDFYSFGGKFKVNPLARYKCGNKYFVFVGGVSHRENSEIDIEEIVSNSNLTRTDYIYTYFEDSKDNVKSIGTASGGGGSTGGGGGLSTPQYWTLDEDGNLKTEYNAYSTKGLSAFGFEEESGGSGGGSMSMMQGWTFTTATENYYLPAKLAVPFYDDTRSRLSALEAGEGGQVLVDWESITGKPTTFVPSAHTHTIGDVTGLQIALDDKASLSQLDDKEDKFTKNSAFNKSFGTGLNDVARGNHTHTFGSLTSKPTTLSGYGITDATSLSIFNTHNNDNIRHITGAERTKWDGVVTDFEGHTHTFASLTSKPTTLSGYGITNGALTTTNIIAGNGLAGGGTLAADRTIKLGTPSTLTASTTNEVTASSHTHAITTTSVGLANTIIQTDASGGTKLGNLTIGDWSLLTETSGTRFTIKHEGANKMSISTSGSGVVDFYSDLFIQNGITAGSIFSEDDVRAYELIAYDFVATPKVSFGNGWTAEGVGAELQFKLNGVIQAKIVNGALVSMGEVTAHQ